MTRLTEFYLDRDATNIRLETLEISHPNFSQTYYFVQNDGDGLTATLEDATSQVFEFLPFTLSRSGQNGTLDQGIRVDLGDLNESVTAEIANIRAAGGMLTKPVVKYRAFESDDLTAPLEGPWEFEISAAPRTRRGVSLEAEALRLSLQTTGLLYSFDKFPMLRAFVV
jgi:hypothetical protein